jgi:hypothetical protein
MTTVRPQLTAIAGVAIMTSQWLAKEGRWTVQRVFQTVALFVVGAGVLLIGARSIRVELSTDSVQDYVAENSVRSTGGGSAVEHGFGVAAPLVAVVNTLFRPFLFEARSATMFVSALELTAFWLLAWRRRKDIWNTVKGWRTKPLLRFGVIFTLLYVISLGIVASNLGLIVRQRIFVFPFLFMFFEGIPVTRKTAGVAASVRPGRYSSPEPSTL